MSSRRTPARLNVKLLVVLGVTTALLVGGLSMGYKLRKRSFANRALAAGQAAVATRDWPEAAQQLRQYLSRYPDDLQVLEQYAQASQEIRPQTRELRKGAIEAYRRYLRTRPAEPGITRALGRLYLANGEYNEAAYVYGKRLEVVPDDADSLTGLARALILQAKYAEAMAGPRAPVPLLLKHHPGRPDGYVLLNSIVQRDASRGVLEQARGVLRETLEQAVPAAQEASTAPAEGVDPAPLEAPREIMRAILDMGLQRSPDSPQLLVERARLQRVAARIAPRPAAELRKAADDLEKADSLHSNDPDVLLQLFDEWCEPAYVAVAPDHLQRASAELDRLAQLDAAALAAHDRKPEDLKLARLISEARLALRRGTAEEKAEVARRGREQLTDEELRKFLPMAVRLYLSANQVDQAEAVADEYDRLTQYTIGVNPAIQDSKTLTRASIEYARGSWYAAIARLEPLTVTGSRDPGGDALGLLLACYAATGQHRRVIEKLGSAETGWQDNPAVLRPAVASCAAMGKWPLAERYARMLEQVLPHSDARLLRIRAGVQAAEARITPAEGRKILEELAELRKLHPRWVDIPLLEAQVLFGSGQREEALQSLQRAGQECEHPAPAHLRLCEYYRRLDRRDEAIAACRAAIEADPISAAPRIALAQLQGETSRETAVATLRAGLDELTGRQETATRPAAASAVGLERAAILHELAMHALAGGDRDQAADLLRRMLPDQPGDLSVRIELIRLLDPARHRAEIESLIAEMQSIETDQGIRWRLEQALLWLSRLRTEHLAAAERQRLGRDIAAELRKCIEADVGWEEPVIVLGSLYEEMGDVRRLRRPIGAGCAHGLTTWPSRSICWTSSSDREGAAISRPS